MGTVCIHCAMKGMLEGKDTGTFPNETPEEHTRKHHPDPAAVQLERLELERKLADKLGVKR